MKNGGKREKKKLKKGTKKSVKREEKREIGVRTRETILLFPYNRLKKLQNRKEFLKISRGGKFFLGGYNIYTSMYFALNY